LIPYSVAGQLLWKASRKWSMLLILHYNCFGSPICYFLREGYGAKHFYHVIRNAIILVKVQQFIGTYHLNLVVNPAPLYIYIKDLAFKNKKTNVTSLFSVVSGWYHCV
jgi:hypothetical protein